MKTIHLIIVLLTATICSQAQVWAPAGATWHYDWVEFATDGYAKIVYVKDSIVDGKLCKVLQAERHTYSWTTHTYTNSILGYEYTYLENNVVYYCRYGTFFKLYDFSAQAGNSWVVAGWEQGNPCDSLGSILVDSTGMATINSFSLKYLKTSPGQNSEWGFDDKVVERLGSFSYMFPSPLCAVDIPGPGQLRCYYDNEFGLYQRSGNPPTCDYITGVENKDPLLNQIRIYPNPVLTEVTIEMNKTSTKDYLIEISDIMGRIVKRFNINKEISTIDFRDLKDGLYFLKIVGSNGCHVNETLIKNIH